MGTRELDEQEKLIVRELIKDPRISDNQISQKTNIPLKSVNRKRKKMEFEGLLSYYAHLDNTEKGTGRFGGRHLYTIKLNHGISRKSFLDFLKNNSARNNHKLRHVHSTFLGTSGGNLVLVKLIESRLSSDIIEIFNCDLVPEIKQHFGEDAIVSADVIQIDEIFRMFHNYMPGINMTDGKISEHWNDDMVFVD
ncbi:MAG: Lrp/AsnC family transcriptional regulator [Candidatus Woesearchaeota archaeon]